MLITNKEYNFKNSILRYFVAILICSNFALITACQNKQKTAGSTIQECQQLLDKDDLSGASACFQKAILSNPENAEEISKAGQDAVFKKCNEFKKEKDFKNSIICFEGLTELKSESANVYFLLASSYYEYDKTEKSKDFELLDKAEEAIKKGLEISPNDAAARSLYGEILKERGDIRGAIREHQKAVELEPETEVFWMKLGMVQEKDNDTKGAIESYEKALKIKPDSTLTLYFLGNLYSDQGETDKAIEAFEKLFELNPDYDVETKAKLKSLKEKAKKKPNN